MSNAPANTHQYSRPIKIYNHGVYYFDYQELSIAPLPLLMMDKWYNPLSIPMSTPIPEDTTIMNFRHLLEKYQLAAGILEVINDYLREIGLSLRQGTIVDATIIHASTE